MEMRRKASSCSTGGSWEDCLKPALPLGLGFPFGSGGKESTCTVGVLGLIPGLGRSPGEIATHSSTLAWKIPRIEKPGRLQSMGSQRVGHN